MAERNVLYQKNQRSLNIPTLDYANARAISQGSAQLNSSINRLTAFVSQKNQQVTAVKGAEYGAANAPTVEQINDALKTGEALDLPGSKTGTLFDRNVNKAAMEVFSDNLETAARSQITQKTIDALDNSMPMSEMRNSLDAIIQGYADSFDEVDAGFAQRFKARMGIVANAEYKTYAGQYRTKMEKEIKASFVAGFKITLDDELLKIITNGISVEGRDGAPDTTTAATKEIVQGMKAKIGQKMVLMGFAAPAIEKHLNAFDTKVKEHAENIIQSFIVDTDDIVEATTKSQRLLNGNIPDNIKSALELLGPDELQNARELAEKSLNLFMEEEKNQLEARKILDETNNRSFTREIGAALLLQANNYEEGKAEIMRVLQDYEKVLPFEVAEFREKNNIIRVGAKVMPNISDETVMAGFTQDLFSATQKYTVQNVLDAKEDGNLSQLDFEDTITKYAARADKNYEKALSYGKLKFGLNDNMFILAPGSENAKRVNAMNEFESAMIDARELKPLDFNAMQWAKANVQTYVDMIEGDANNDQKTLDGIEFTKNQIDQVVSGTLDSVTFEEGTLTKFDAIRFQKLIKDPKLDSSRFKNE